MKLTKNSLQRLKHIYQGMGTTLELQGRKIPIVRRYKPAETSAKALQSDWQKVGAQLWQALERNSNRKEVFVSGYISREIFPKKANTSQTSDDFSGEADLKVKE